MLIMGNANTVRAKQVDVNPVSTKGRIKISRPMLGMTRNIVKMEINGGAGSAAGKKGWRPC